VRTVTLEMAEAAWQSLASDPTAEAYAEGTVRVAGLGATPAEDGVWSGVGVRFQQPWAVLSSFRRLSL
jgi:hypothetical protein